MGVSLADILSIVQQGVIAFNNLGVQVKGSFNNISSQLTAIQNLASPIKASLGADVALNNIANYFDGPSVAQGITGTWFVSGTVTVVDTVSGAFISAKLWDGATVIASAETTVTAANLFITISLSGYMSSPAGNLRISCKDATTANGKILFNNSGNSKDSTITAYRIG